MIAVTETAAAQIAKLMVKEHADATGLRVGVKAGGCSGFEYVFAWEAAPREGDLVFDAPNGVRVWVDPRSHRLYHRIGGHRGQAAVIGERDNLGHREDHQFGA